MDPLPNKDVTVLSYYTGYYSGIWINDDNMSFLLCWLYR